MDKNERINHIRDRIKIIEREKADLEKELSSFLHLPLTEKTIEFIGEKASESTPRSPAEKIELFLELFRCRKDVYPKYWENIKSGKKGYSPVCKNEWIKGVCFKPSVKCTNCTNQGFLPLDETAAKNHLLGKTIIGSYAINPADKCKFLAADFDKSTWQEDVTEYRKAAADPGIHVAVEISRSGKGAHAWIFFSELVPAVKARQLGDIILTLAMSGRKGLQLDSYDRFFPNQDLLPSGGFGNLIALPLQKNLREKGFTCFVDENLNVITDQWDYLSNISRLSESDIDTILYSELNLFKYNTDLSDDDRNISISEKIMQLDSDDEDEYSGEVSIIFSGQIAIRLSELPGKIINKLKKIATFANPKYFEAQRMRFSTWNIPKYIFCGDNDSEFIYLPRGVINKVKFLLEDNGFDVILTDQRNISDPMEFSFEGELYDYQKEAVAVIKDNENGVLVAPTGTGKTVIAVKMIAERNRPAIILVHRNNLIEQWIDSICRFIPEIEKKDIGVLGAGRKKLKGKIDIAMLQSLSNKEGISELTNGYEFVIIDECHRLPTVTFEPVIKSIAARYILGLTATPKRKDQFQKIIYMQCGPIIHTIEDVYKESQNRQVEFRETDVPEMDRNQPVHLLWENLINNKERNDLIIGDIISLLSEKRSPVILSDRVEHISMLEIELGNKKPDEIPVYKLIGGMGKKERNYIKESIVNNLKENKVFCLFATGSLIGEGFDIPELDTLLITLPISFKGRLTQYVGRLHRATGEDKKEIVVYDYVDACSGMTISMFKKRLPAYRKLGYELKFNENGPLAKWI